ncbi:MAG: phage head closure protein [Xanthomonas sp.]
MRAGELNRRLKLLKSAQVKDGFGDVVETFAEAAEVWAKDEPLSLKGMASAKVAILGGAETAVGLRYITIRYRADVTTKWRLAFVGGRLDGQQLMLKDVRDAGDGVSMFLIAQVLNG